MRSSKSAKKILKKLAADPYELIKRTFVDHFPRNWQSGSIVTVAEVTNTCYSLRLVLTYFYDSSSSDLIIYLPIISLVFSASESFQNEALVIILCQNELAFSTSVDCL